MMREQRKNGFSMDLVLALAVFGSALAYAESSGA